MKYWRWLISGSGAGAGIRRFFDRWFLVHIGIGLLLAWLLPISLMEAARGLILPLAGIFIGLSFAWGGNAQALLGTTEVEELTEHHPGGFEEYIYTYQSSILLILVALVLWGVAGLGIFDKTWPKPCREVYYFAIGSILFLFTSFTLRECWHVVLGSQSLLIVRYKIKKNRANKKEDARGL